MGYRLPFSNGIHCFPPSILRQLVGKLPVYWLHLIDFHRIIRLQHETGAKIFFNIKAVLFVIVRQIPVILMFADVIFIREERPDTTKLQDTFSAVHNCYFILAHQLLPCFLVIHTIGTLASPRIRGIIKINRFLSQKFRHLF